MRRAKRRGLPGFHRQRFQPENSGKVRGARTFFSRTYFGNPSRP
jgi:hypothetical protein